MKFETVTLKDLTADGKGHYGIGASAVEPREGLYTYLRITDIRDDGTLNAEGLKCVDDPDANKYLLKPDDIVFARTGASTGRNYFYDARDGEFVYAGFLIKFSLDPRKVNPKYIKYYCQSDLYKNWIASHSTGSTRGNINAQAFGNMPITLPSRQQQDFLVDLLAQVDDKIRLNNKINDNLEQQAEALYKAWFIDYLPFAGEKPEEWNNTIIEELTSLVSRGITPKYTEDSDQIVINQKCVRDHRIDLSLARTHTPKKINEKWLQYGDLLINSTGEGTLGRAAQVWFKPEKMTVDSHVTIVRPKSKELMYYIGFWGLLHEREIESLHTGSTGQTELPRERIKAMELVLPDQETLAKFNAIVQPMTETIINNQDQNNKLAALRDALLPKLMAGEIL